MAGREAPTPGGSTSSAPEPYDDLAVKHLLEVKVPVQAILGTLQLRLRDFSALKVGSVLRTRKALSDPLDLRVNSTILASAEVFPNGNKLGLRLLELHLQDD